MSHQEHGLKDDAEPRPLWLGDSAATAEAEAQRERVAARAPVRPVDDLREAARAFLAALADGDAPQRCNTCGTLATRVFLASPGARMPAACDPHGDGGRDLSYAPALRRLRALLAPAHDLKTPSEPGAPTPGPRP